MSFSPQGGNEQAQSATTSGNTPNQTYRRTYLVKKMITIALALSLLTACGGKDNSSTPPTNNSTNPSDVNNGGNDNGGGSETGWAKFPLGKPIPEPADWPANPTKNTDE
ncbi:hypothetical protein FACS189415_1260 [Bacteroidia bacterium]|nr:hypothetical protein FACS189415_1260 [Bacteroidia bacterium]